MQREMLYCSLRIEQEVMGFNCKKRELDLTLGKTHCRGSCKISVIRDLKKNRILLWSKKMPGSKYLESALEQENVLLRCLLALSVFVCLSVFNDFPIVL